MIDKRILILIKIRSPALINFENAAIFHCILTPVTGCHIIQGYLNWLTHEGNGNLIKHQVYYLTDLLNSLKKTINQKFNITDRRGDTRSLKTSLGFCFAFFN